MKKFILGLLLCLFQVVHAQDREAIIGGSYASGVPAGIVALSDKASGYFFCGGVRINAYDVITAAHCVTGVVPSSIMVGMGSKDRFDQVRQVVEKVRIHPDYTGNFNDGTRNAYDIAILTLRHPATTGTVARVGDNVVEDGTSLTTFGWGVASNTAGTPTERYLKQLTVIKRSLQACVNVYGFGTAQSYCLDGGFGNDTAPGDSGSPTYNSLGNVVAITSYGMRVAGTAPAVYTALFYYKGFIRGTTLRFARRRAKLGRE